jgi:hypothetical protein
VRLSAEHPLTLAAAISGIFAKYAGLFFDHRLFLRVFEPVLIATHIYFDEG